MKTVTILRGVSGSGKSTFAHALWTGDESVICCADDYMVDSDGNYSFDASRLEHCHGRCYAAFDEAISRGVEHIVVANTNTMPWEFKRYQTLAEQKGYMVFHVIVENRRQSKNVHSVPITVLKQQEERLRQSITLV